MKELFSAGHTTQSCIPPLTTYLSVSMLLYPITYSTLYNADVWKFKFYTCISLCIYRIIFYTTLMVPQYKQEQWQWCKTTENNRWLRSATRGSPWICSLAMWAININTNLYSWSKQNLKQKHKSYICNTKLMLFINCFSLFYERSERNKSNIDRFFILSQKLLSPPLKNMLVSHTQPSMSPMGQ